MTKLDRHCAYCGYNYNGHSKCPECKHFATRPLSQCRKEHTLGIKTDYKGKPLDQSPLAP